MNNSDFLKKLNSIQMQVSSLMSETLNEGSVLQEGVMDDISSYLFGDFKAYCKVTKEQALNVLQETEGYSNAEMYKYLSLTAEKNRNYIMSMLYDVRSDLSRTFSSGMTPVSHPTDGMRKSDSEIVRKIGKLLYDLDNEKVGPYIKDKVTAEAMAVTSRITLGSCFILLYALSAVASIAFVVGIVQLAIATSKDGEVINKAWELFKSKFSNLFNVIKDNFTSGNFYGIIKGMWECIVLPWKTVMAGVDTLSESGMSGFSVYIKCSAAILVTLGIGACILSGVIGYGVSKIDERNAEIRRLLETPIEKLSADEVKERRKLKQ